MAESCMNSGESFILYKDAKYRNPAHAENTKQHFYAMWTS
jgi:hypothetical protein